MSNKIYKESFYEAKFFEQVITEKVFEAVRNGDELIAKVLVEFLDNVFVEGNEPREDRNV